MSYNRKNQLQRIIDIQAIVLEHKTNGATQEWIYNNVIFPRYRISRARFYDFLGTNAKAELKRVLATEALQSTLF